MTSIDPSRYKRQKLNKITTAVDSTSTKSKLSISHRPLNSSTNNNKQPRAKTAGAAGTTVAKPKVLKPAALKRTALPTIPTRPKTTIGPPKAVHFSNIVDRFHPGFPTSRILLAKQESSECEKTCFVADDAPQECPPIPNIPIPIPSENQSLFNSETDGLAVVVADDCKFEFMNKSFNYDDDTISVVEFSPEDTPRKKKEKDREKKSDTTAECSVRFQDEGDAAYQSTTLLNLMKSVLTPLTNVTQAGERILRGVTGAFFSANSKADLMEEENTILTYNDYSIKTSGRSMLVNSVLFGVKADQKIRVLVEIKELENPILSQRQRRTRKPKLVIGMLGATWTLTKRNDLDERTGMLEIKVPASVSLSKIKIKGPYEGLICINIP